MISIKSRASIRGLKKCIACGKYNGVRASSCKNKLCSLAVTSSVKKPLIEPVQLITNTEYKLYSVRIRDRGPEFRSFVKITDKTISSDKDASIISRNAICFVDTCKYDSKDINISCKHVKTATASVNLATVLKVQKNIVFCMDMANEMQEMLWELYCENENTTPAVQRISKSVFSVKCDVTQRFPTGFLHVYLTGGDGKTEAKYSCACKKIKISLTPYDSVIVENEACSHLYLLIAAILSNESLITEFRSHTNIYLKTDNIVKSGTDTNCTEFDFPFGDLNETIDETNFGESLQGENIALVDLIDYNPNAIDAMIEDYDTGTMEGLELTDCQIELMDQFKLTDQIDLCQSEIELTEQDLLMGESFNSISSIFIENEFESETMATTTVAQPVVERPKSSHKPATKRRDWDLDDDNGSDERVTSMEFECWLSFVIERINSAMDFNDSSGLVKDMSFHISHNFFDQLRAKFSIGQKKRLPNSSKIMKSGQFKGLTIHTYKFYRLDILRRILRTQKVQLDVEIKFTKDEKDNFVRLAKQPESTSAVSSATAYCKIQPTMYRTFLRVGGHHQDPKANPFTIEWIPNVYKTSRFGLMQISYRYGHKKNNVILMKQNANNNVDIN